MSAEELYPQYRRSSRPTDDPRATRPLPVSEIVDRSADLPHPAGPAALPRARRRRPPRRRSSMLLNFFLTVLILMVLAAGGGLYYLDRSYQGRIYPNITVQGIRVGDMTPQQAEAALRARYGAFLERPATLTFGDRVWRPTPEDLGIVFEFKDAINSAYQAGRGNGLIANLQAVAAIWQNGFDLPLHVSFDQRAMQRYVAGIGAGLEQSPADAQLRLDGISVTTQSARVGRQVLVDETVQNLTAGLRGFTHQTVALRTRTVAPRLDDAAVAAAKGQIEAILQGPLTLTIEDKQYIWAPEDLALMLEIARVPRDSSSDQVVVALNQYQVDRRVRLIADETGRGSVNPRVAWNGGDLKITRPGKPGLRVDEEHTRELIMTSAANQERVLALPVREVAPQVTEANLHQIGIKELVSVGRSDFTGSAEYRITNIGAGMRMLDGILLAPGEEFSFNENIGSIDAKNGFVEGYAIIQNRTQLEFGGGICQDSTTLFRAAFWAGLPITERWGHSFYISWYDKYGLGSYGDGAGLDATIFTGGPDLKFVNDTGNWLLIQTLSNPRTGLAEVAFYGTKPDRQVFLTHKLYDRIPAPTNPEFIPDAKQPRGWIKRSDTARGGMTIDVYRTVVENGVKSAPELFRTKFRPWANKYLVNPADMGPDGRPLIWSTTPEAPPAPEQAQPAPEQPQPAPEQPQPAPEAQPAPAPEQQPAPEQPQPNG